MSMLEKVSELESRKTAILNGNEASAKAAEAKGKLTARARIGTLLDENSFVEIGAFIKSRNTAFNMEQLDTTSDGVVCGYGTINNNLVYVYTQDASIIGGALGEMHAKKITKIYEDALKMGAPVIGFLDTVGLRLQEGIDALQGYGEILTKMTEAKGVIPQISVICGDCAGSAAFIAGLSDFVLMSNKNGKMFLNSPNTLEGNNAFDQVATAKVHFEESGLVQFVADKEEELIAKVQELLSYLPQNNGEDVPLYECLDDLNRVDPNLNSCEDVKGEALVASIVDNGEYLEVSAGLGTDIFVGFARMNGSTVGMLANKESVVRYKGIQKMTRFISFCNDFNIPIVTLTDIERFDSTVETERLGIIKAVSDLVNAFAQATVAKVNVILKHAYGAAYLTMNSKHVGADYVYAWPSAVVATMNAQSAVKIIYAEEIQKAEVASDVLQQKTAEFEASNNVYAAAARGYVDDIIEPAATRKRIIAALEVLYTKEI